MSHKDDMLFVVFVPPASEYTLQELVGASEPRPALSHSQSHWRGKAGLSGFDGAQSWASMGAPDSAASSEFSTPVGENVLILLSAYTFTTVTLTLSSSLLHQKKFFLNMISKPHIVENLKNIEQQYRKQ